MNASYRCPQCKAGDDLLNEAAGERETWRCQACDARYPVVCGIPDLRIAPDPYIGLEADRDKARGLAERFEDLDLASLIDHYFAITPEVPAQLAARYRIGLLESGPARASALLDRIDEDGRSFGREARVLEVGCGSGPFLPDLSARFEHVVALDIALRWLVIARKRLLELGLDERVQLVCACAESLPFANQHFDLAIAGNAIEHVRDARKLLAELARVLAPEGRAGLTTPNRFSLGPDPHVGIWAIGLLPRATQDRVARRLRGAGLERIHTRSHAELRRLLADAGFHHATFALPAVSPADLAQRNAAVKQLGKLYNRLRESSVAHPLLLRVGPLFQIVARR